MRSPAPNFPGSFPRFRRRGVVIVQTAVALPMLLAMGALTVDIGRLYMAKNQLQVAADAAAMAGASGYLTDVGLAGRLSNLQLRNNTETQALVRQRSSEFSYRNPTFGDRTALETADLVLGTYDFDNPNKPLDTSGAKPFNAVQVTVRRTEGSTNGPVDFFFARVFGRKKGGVTATATAVIDDRFAGFDPRQRGAAPVIPVAMQKDVYEHLLADGGDGYSYDDTDDSVEATGDGIGEVHLFPWKWFGNGDALGMIETGILPTDLAGEASGNFGYLDFGSTAPSASELGGQIREGLSQGDIQDTIGQERFDFTREDGSPAAYEILGAPGMKVSTDDDFGYRLGDVVGFFIYDWVRGNGSNATYHITDIRFGRVMYVDLHGGPKNKRVVIQPTAYAGAGVWIDNGAPMTGGQVGKIALVR